MSEVVKPPDATKYTFDLELCARDADSLMKTQRETARNLFKQIGTNVAAWNGDQFNHFVTTMTVGCIAHAMALGYRRELQFMEGCSDD
jgi:hypothetical protein